MKRTVYITCDIDPEEYEGAPNTDKAAIEVMEAILKGEADWSESPIHITCGSKIKNIKLSK
jgi:hypothetical protein